MDDLVDVYRVLGVQAAATQAELKAAHRALLRRHHPDLVPPAQREAADRRMREINVAYGLVRNREARARYDRLRRMHAARRTAERYREQVDDEALAAQWDTLARAAGRWAGGWMHRSAGLSYRAGRTLGRWLS